MFVLMGFRVQICRLTPRTLKIEVKTDIGTYTVFVSCPCLVQVLLLVSVFHLPDKEALEFDPKAFHLVLIVESNECFMKNHVKKSGNRTIQ